MRKPSAPPRQILAANLRMLMAETGLSGPQVARLAGISPKSVNNMMHGRHGPNLDHVAMVASVFQLNLWQLILPDLRTSLTKNGHMESLIEHYMQSSDQGRANIDRVAELEAKYSVEK